MHRSTSEMLCRALLAMAAVAIFLSLIPCAVHAQILYGSLTGTVSDASQAAVPGAAVEATNTGTGVVRQTTTNATGNYLFTDLQPGAYKLAITSPAFARQTLDGIQVEVNRVRRVDATLQVAQVAETVEVSGAAQTLQTDRADVNINIGTKQVEDLPVTGTSGRNFQSLMTIIPGAIMAGEQNSAAGNPQRAISFNMNGVSRLQNNTKLDGSSVVYPWLPTNIAYVPPAEAIETVNVVTNSFNAEQGQAGGAAVNVIIKSGTNEFHGGGWIYDTNSHFKARNFFQTTPQNPKDILNQYGVRFGGPVFLPKVFNGKNKLFFFVDWERTTRRQTSPIRLYSLATAPLRTGDFSGASTVIYDPDSSPTDPTRRTPFGGNLVPTSRIDSASAKLISWMPSPNLPGVANNYTASGVGSYTRDNVDIKVNHHVSDRIAYFGRYSISPSNIFDPPALGAAGGDALNGGQVGNAPGRIQVAGAGVTLTISPTLVFDTNLGYTRQRLGAQNVDIDTNYGLDVLKIPGTNGSDRLQGGIPFFNASNWANLGNSNTGNPFLFRDNQYVASGGLGWMKNTHSIRFGYDVQNQQINHFQPQGGTFQTPRGTFQFNGQSTVLQNGGPAADRYNTWADFLLGYASGAGKAVQFVNPDSVYMHSYALFAQDQWQATKKLTVNYGMRWEWYPFPKRDHGGVSRFDPADGNIYIGGAGSTPVDTYATSGKGLFLPRLGLAYRLNDKTVVRSGFGFSADPKPFIDFRNAYPIISNSAMTNPGNNPYLAVTTLRQGIAVVAVPDMTNGVIKLPATVGTTTFPRNAMRKYVESWNFFIQRDIHGYSFNTGYVGTRAVGQQQFININSSAPGTGTNGRALYAPFGLTADINEIMPFKTTTYDGWQTQLTKRWSGSQFGISYTWSHGINWADNDSNPRTQYPGAWGMNRGTASYDRTHTFQPYWTLESPFGKGHKFMQNGLGGKVLGGWELTGILYALSGQPFWPSQGSGANLNAAGSSQTPDQVKQTVQMLGGIGLGHAYFDTTAFASVNIPSGQQQRFGNAGRNTLRGPGVFSIDGGLFRTFTVAEKLKLQFRVEALNIPNHPNFSNPAVNVSDPSTFGYITSTSTGERQFRFAARLYF